LLKEQIRDDGIRPAMETLLAVDGGKMSKKIYEASATPRCNAETFSSLINLCKRFYVN
jgi:hypothetical protein